MGLLRGWGRTYSWWRAAQIAQTKELPDATKVANAHKMHGTGSPVFESNPWVRKERADFQPRGGHVGPREMRG